MKIIVAEDEPINLMLVKDILEQTHFEVVEATNGLQALELAKQHKDAQLFLVDWQMPELDGLSLCARIKSFHSLSISYIIIMTGKNSTADLVYALESGADDFIEKPLNREELIVRLKVGARIIERENQLLKRSMRDPLTSILNHRAVLESLSQSIELAKREARGLAVMMLDIDQFKRLNDNYGHQAGDHALKQFCLLVKSELRPYDSFGRYGGDEFLVCLPSTSKEESIAVAERIRLRVESYPLEYDGLCFCITVSVGIVNFDEKEDTEKSLVMKADKTTFNAKSNGGNQVVVYKDY